MSSHKLATYLLRVSATSGTPLAYSVFAEAIAATHDFDGDGFDDLVVGAPGEDLGASGALTDAGEVSVVFGSASGLELSSAVRVHQSLVGLLAEAGDQFGELAAPG